MESSALDYALDCVAPLFETIGAQTREGLGVTRAAFDSGETTALNTIKSVAESYELQASTDHAANLYLTLEGAQADAASVFVGSHLDSVPNGGNYDGLAGVLAGLAVAIAYRRLDVRPSRNLVVMGIRGEENAWFGVQHIGSRAALGLLSPQLLDDAHRVDTGLSLGAHMAEAGADLAALRNGERHLGPQNVHCYAELQIEQGPVLETMGHPVGVVTDIRGNVRCPENQVHRRLRPFRHGADGTAQRRRRPRRRNWSRG